MGDYAVMFIFYTRSNLFYKSVTHCSYKPNLFYDCKVLRTIE